MIARNFIFIALLGLSCLLTFHTLAFANSSLEAVSDNGGICNAPAPTNFQVVQIGTTWVKLSWQTSNPSDAHRVKTYETNSGLLVSNILVSPGSLVCTVTGLQPGVDYYSRVNVVCKNGYDSENNTEITHTTLIAELIVIGKDGTSNTPQCSITSAPGTCTFAPDGSESNFKIRPVNNPNLGRRFNVSKNQASGHLRTSLQNTNTGEAYTIQCNNQDPDCQGTLFQISVNGQLIVSYELSYMPYPANQGVLNCNFLDSNFEIVKLVPNGYNNPIGPTTGSSKDFTNDKLSSLVPLDITALPNPFTESLTLRFNTSSSEPIAIKLMNLNGQIVLEQQYQAGMEAIELNTATFPTGFYLLRVKTSQGEQTLKVVKTE